jgi:hypothetical protein
MTSLARKAPVKVMSNLLLFRADSRREAAAAAHRPYYGANGLQALGSKLEKLHREIERKFREKDRRAA